jgi:hypothetical protein
MTFFVVNTMNICKKIIEKVVNESLIVVYIYANRKYDYS